ncbi:MAG: acyl-CoA dehydrogenase family protein [Elusimicrobia bacterium]|nr:acyl-CoA dehydrogenase family protein [Elusimicrobiota bacterium]
MDFELNEQQKLLQESAREFAERLVAPRAQTFDDEEAIPPELYAEIGRSGYFGLLVPEEHGGLEVDAVSYVCVMEELAKACAGLQVGLSVHNSLVCRALLEFGSPEQKKNYLPRLARGEIIGAYSLTEPASGTDAGSLRCGARADGDCYVLNGSKSWVTNAGIAGLIVLFVSTDKSKGSRGISCLLLEKGAPGFSIGAKEKKMGIRASDTRELSLQNCRVPKSALLGRENEGFKIALNLLDNGRIGIAAQAVGIAQAAYEKALAYSKTRIQFGAPISGFQAVQFKLADMALQIESARLLTYRAAWMKDKGLRCSKEISMAKLAASECANRVAYQAVQIHGANGYSREYAVERFFRDARVTEIYEGTSEAQRMVISREILKSHRIDRNQ